MLKIFNSKDHPEYKCERVGIEVAHTMGQEEIVQIIRTAVQIYGPEILKQALPEGTLVQTTKDLKTIIRRIYYTEGESFFKDALPGVIVCMGDPPPAELAGQKKSPYYLAQVENGAREFLPSRYSNLEGVLTAAENRCQNLGGRVDVYKKVATFKRDAVRPPVIVERFR